MTQYVPYVSKDFPIEGSFLRLDDKDKAWNEIDGRMRTAVRKGQQSGAIIRKVEGTTEEVEAFRAFCLNPGDIPPKITDRYHLYFAYLQEELVAGILLSEVANKLFMLCHASTDKAKKANIPSLLIWHVVEQFAGSKFIRIDIGAAFRASLQGFFTGWRTQSYPVIMKPPELQPTLMFTPFDTQAMDMPIAPDARDIVRTHLEAKFDDKPYTFFPRATYAIFTIIRWLKNEGKLSPDDEVYIATTPDTPYISSCVTSAIEQTCKWSQKLSDKTKAIFVIHEFGFLHPKLKELRTLADDRGIPLIEDCAYAWSTVGAGKTGDYIITSLTKAFPLQFGGYLAGKHFPHEELWNDYQCSDRGKEEFTEQRLAHWLPMEAESHQKRRANYEYFQQLFGIDRTYFPYEDGTFPGTFVLKMSDEETMKTTSAFVRRFGIECGNYWKNSAIMLPVHQRLTPAHLEYIAGSVFATEREWCGVPGYGH